VSSNPLYGFWEPTRHSVALQDKYGTAWGNVHGFFKDALKEGALRAIAARFPSKAPPDALPELGRDRLMERGRAESEAAYRTRLRQAHAFARLRGTAYGITHSIALSLGLGDSQVRHVSWKEWESDDADKWGLFWVVIYPPHGFHSSGEWGGAGLLWGAGFWGSDASEADVATMRARIADMKRSSAKLVAVIVLLSGQIWDPTGSWSNSSSWGGRIATYAG
jgi:hypothetical protein